MFDLPTDLPADIVPLSWLLGVWEGTGVIDHEAEDGAVGGVEDAQGHDVDLAAGEALDKFVESAEAVRREHGELQDGLGSAFPGNARRYRRNRHGATIVPGYRLANPDVGPPDLPTVGGNDTNAEHPA